MNKENLENYLHTFIPISKAIGIRVELASVQEVILYASFSNNINHKKTVFGGSLHAVATLACWSLLHLNLASFNPLDLVISHSDVDYLLPVKSDFKAHCRLPENVVWQRFITMLQHKGKSRIKLQSQIFQNEKLAVKYQGIFAALKKAEIY